MFFNTFIKKTLKYFYIYGVVYATEFRAAGWRDFFQTRASKSGTSPKTRYFTAIGSYSVKTVAGRHRLLLFMITSTDDEISGGMNIGDLERP